MRAPTAAAVVLLILTIFSQPCAGQLQGLADGNLAILATQDRVVGYSAYTCLWGSMDLAGQLIAMATSPSLGLVLTDEKSLAFNSINGRWYRTNFAGSLQGWDVDGAVAAFWSTQACFGISTVWSSWCRESLKPAEVVLGGGSAGSFAFLWTNQYLRAYNGNTGTWLSQRLGLPAIGGIASNGLGMGWSDDGVYVFEPNPAHWVHLPMLGFPDGAGVSGDENVAMVWSASQVRCYSGYLEQWFTLTVPVLGGSAAGNVALAWNQTSAYSFDANTGSWSMIDLQHMLAPADGDDLGDRPSESPFQAFPNPSPDGDLMLRLPAGSPWTIEIVDVEGRRVRRLDSPMGGESPGLAWDWTDDAGSRLGAGTYWVLARSGDRVESRRVVRLP